MADGEQTLTINDVKGVLGVTQQAADKWIKKRSVARIRAGKRYEYLLHSFPADFQNRWLVAHPPTYNKDTSTALPSPESDIYNKEGGINGDAGDSPAPVPAVRPPSLPPTMRSIVGDVAPISYEADSWNDLAESCRNKGYDILLLVNRVREIRGKAGRGRDAALNEYAKSVDCHPHSLLRYLQKADAAIKEAQAEGRDTIMAQIRALAPKHGRTKDRVVAYDSDAVVYAMSLYASGEMRNKSQVYELTLKMAQEKGWKTGTYATMLNYLNRLDPSTATLARHGEKAFEADRLVKILRNYDEISPLFMSCGDHHIFDVFVKLPNGKGGWNYRRPWLTSWMDMRTRSLMGWCISFAPNSRTIAMALHHAIMPKNDPNFPQHGLPSSVYIDNGKDYKSKYLNGEEIAIGKIDYPDIMERYAALGIDPFYIDLEYDAEEEIWVKKRGDRAHQVKGVRVGGVYARLGIGQRYATVYHPWAKPVERFHRTLVQSFSRELPGWCGSGHEQRPEKLAFELRSGNAILTLEEFCSRFYDWVVNVYHKTRHRGHGMNGMTPTEAFTSMMPEPSTVEPALLDFALMKKENVTVHNWGFNLNGREFELAVPVNLQGARVLNILIGTRVAVFYDFDYKTLRIYRDGKYVCDGRPLNRASFVTPNDPAMIDKLRIAALQKRDAKAKIRVFEAAAAEAEAEAGDETAALLALTQGEAMEMPDTVQMDSSPDSTAEPPPLPSIDPYDELVFITRPDRYRGQIIPKLARGRELTPAQQTFREEFESSQMYLESKQLYDAHLDYEKYLAGGQR